MFTRVCRNFGLNFCRKKAPRSSRLVLALRSHGWTGLKLGAVRKDFPGGREWKRGAGGLRWQIHYDSSSERTFPVEGNRNLNPNMRERSTELKRSERTFPVEGNGNFLSVSAISSRDHLSERTFPVEGNGNEKWFILWWAVDDGSERTFPVEGNGNITSNKALHRSHNFSPKGLSRWKGMETYSSKIKYLCSVNHVRKDFPGGREWKLNNFGVVCVLVNQSERTFPVEGNGNS